MKKSNTKNIVFLKEINSNIVDEAIIILKPNIKCEEYIVHGEVRNKSEENRSDYVINEAKLVVSNYISKINNNEEKKLLKCNKKLKKMKITNIVLFISLIVSLIFRII